MAHGLEPKAALPHQLLPLLPPQLLQGVAGQRPAPPTSLLTDEVFVVFRPGPTTASVSAQLGGRARPLSTGGYAATLPVRSGETLAEALKRWGASPGAAPSACGLLSRVRGCAGLAWRPKQAANRSVVPRSHAAAAQQWAAVLLGATMPTAQLRPSRPLSPGSPGPRHHAAP